MLSRNGPASRLPPPRPGTAKYEQFMRGRKRKRLEPRSRGSRPPNRPLIHKHHGLAAVEDHAVLQMIAYRARQHAALDVAALASKIVGRIAMADALDILVDDRAFIEVAGNVMRGGTDQLDAALVRLVIGTCAPLKPGRNE
jgi:hypothetical protein